MLFITCENSYVWKVIVQSHLLNYTEDHKASLNHLLDKTRELGFSLELFSGTPVAAIRTCSKALSRCTHTRAHPLVFVEKGIVQTA